MNTSPTRFLNRPDGRIAYSVGGDGPLVIAVPGMGDLRSSYRDVAPALIAAGFRVAVADVRGHGASDTGFRELGDVATADDIEALITELGGPALVLGNSFAGSAAVIAAARRPDLVSGTVLISPFLRQPATSAVAVAALRVVYRVLFARPWGARAWASYFRSALNKGATAPWLDEHTADIRASLRSPERLRSFRRLALSLDHDVVAPFVDAARAVPSLTIVGALDPDYPDAEAELTRMGAELGGATLLVADAAHYAHTQQGPIVIPAIVEFAQQLRSTTGSGWGARA